MRFSSSDGSAVVLSSLAYDWESENATLEVISTDYVVDTRYTLQMFPSSASTVVLQLLNIPLSLSDTGRALSANLRIKADSPITTSSLLFIDSASAAYTPHQQTFTSGKYNAIHTNAVSVPDDDSLHTANIYIEIENHNSVNIYATLPHLIHELGFYENPIVGGSRNFLPDFYFEIDSAQEHPSYPFFRLIDILFADAGETMLEHDRMYGVEMSQVATPDETTEYWAKSSLVSPRSVREAYIPWLSQFTGGAIKQNIQAEDGSLYLDNEALRRDFIEWQLSGSHYSRAAGTREAMIEAAKRVLIKTKDSEPSTFSVALTPRYQSDPFAIGIQTLTNETPDASVGESSYLVLQSVNWAKPLGYKIFHTTVDAFYFTLDDPTLGVLDDFRFG
jgi:hypothetical protein